MIFERATEIDCSADALFAYHARRGALARLTPPFMRVRNVVEIPALENGAEASMELATGPVWQRIVARHMDVRPGRGFVDVMREGPFRRWRHEHIFEPIDDEHARLIDRITWDLPAGAGAGNALVEHRLARTFAHRHATTRLDVDLFRDKTSRTALVVAMTGASGLIGHELTSLLQVAGHTVIPIARGHIKSADDRARWDPVTGDVAFPPGTPPIDVVVHLAGESVADGRLDPAHAERVRQSRVDATERLVDSLLRLPRPPRAFIGASAVGYYGDRGDEILDEKSPRGSGLLADICAAWEDAVLQVPAAVDGRLRAVVVRTGIALSPMGGALARALPAFRAGAGARLGDGTQWMPLVAIDDVGAAFYRAIVDDDLRGPIIAAGLEPATNAAFTKTLARVLHRPALLTIPRFAARAMFGTAFADEALLSSQRAVPRRLAALEHPFRHAGAEAALRHVLGRTV